MILSIHDVTVVLDKRPIVSGVDLTLAEGTIAGVLGPNGSGKSTLLRAIYRVLRPVSGLVKVGGQDVWQQSAREVARFLAVVCQEQSLTYDLTVAELVRLGRFPHKGLFDRENPRDTEMIHDALKRVGMTGFAERRLSELSGGERQRAVIARGLAQEPRLLILDEPTNHLDIRYQVEVLELLRSFGVSVVVTLHDLNLAAAYCDMLYLIDGGTIVASGSPDQVLIPATLQPVFGVKVARGENPLTGRSHLFFGPETNAR